MRELLGCKFGRWSVMRQDPVKYKEGVHWFCECECGTIRSVKSSSLVQGKSKSCGCLTKDVHRERLRLPDGEQSFNELYRRYKSNAKRKGIEFEFDKDSFRQITQRSCHYCGCTPYKVSRDRYDTGSYTFNGIDRYDNSEGYTLNNSVPCCEACNRAKLMMTADEYINLCKEVARNWKK